MQFLSYDGQCLVYWHACEQGGHIIRYQCLTWWHIEILQCVSEFFAVLDAVDCFPSIGLRTCAMYLAAS